MISTPPPITLGFTTGELAATTPDRIVGRSPDPVCPANEVLRGAPRRRAPVEIVDFVPALAPRFKELNMEWLADFGVEPPDVMILDNPRETILRGGGIVIFARVENQIVGTCALIPTVGFPGHFELAKMAIAHSHRGIGIGRQLLVEALRRFYSLGGSDLHLETSSRLPIAIRLYESVGFRRTVRPAGPSVFTRADVYMVHEADAGGVKQPC